MTCSRLISIRSSSSHRREAKFRATSTKDSAQEIVSGLVRSFKSGLPASLQFVADRNSWPTVCLRAGQKDLGERVMSALRYLPEVNSGLITWDSSSATPKSP